MIKSNLFWYVKYAKKKRLGINLSVILGEWETKKMREITIFRENKKNDKDKVIK